MTASQHRTPFTAIELFRFGHDTAAIGSILKISEAAALKLVTIQRSNDLRLDNPYVRPRSHDLLPYAGKAKGSG